MHTKYSLLQENGIIAIINNYIIISIPIIGIIACKNTNIFEIGKIDFHVFCNENGNAG